MHEPEIHAKAHHCCPNPTTIRTSLLVFPITVAGYKMVHIFVTGQKRWHRSKGKTFSDISEVVCPKKQNLISLNIILFRHLPPKSDGTLVPAQRMTKEPLSVLHMGLEGTVSTP